MILGMFLSGIGYLIMILGGLAAGGLFFYGIYYTIFQSVSEGLMLIGASVVATLVLRFISGLLMVAGSVIANKSIEKELKNNPE